MTIFVDNWVRLDESTLMLTVLHFVLKKMEITLYGATGQMMEIHHIGDDDGDYVAVSPS